MSKKISSKSMSKGAIPLPIHVSQRRAEDDRVLCDGSVPLTKRQDAHASGPPERAVQNGKDSVKKGVAPRYSDYLSNTSNWKIIESTLRGASAYSTATASVRV